MTYKTIKWAFVSTNKCNPHELPQSFEFREYGNKDDKPRPTDDITTSIIVSRCLILSRLTLDSPHPEHDIRVEARNRIHRSYDVI
jgi:hypothetical protein